MCFFKRKDQHFLNYILQKISIVVDINKCSAKNGLSHSEINLGNPG